MTREEIDIQLNKIFEIANKIFPEALELTIKITPKNIYAKVESVYERRYSTYTADQIKQSIANTMKENKHNAN